MARVRRKIYDATGAIYWVAAEELASDAGDAQLVLLVDADGNAITPVGSGGTVVANAGTGWGASGLATAANQLPDGHNVTVDNAAGASAVNIQDGGNAITVDAVDLDVRDLASATDSVTAEAGTSFASAVQVGDAVAAGDQGPALMVSDGANWQRGVQGLTDTQLRATAVPISAASLPLPTGAATAALQLPDGHNVTVDNASGASAVNIQDGGNTITVDGTITANAGTNLNTSLLALETGGNLAAAATSLGTLDNCISGSRALVTEDNSGAIKTAVELIDNCVSGSEFQVDIVGSLPAGTNGIGKLTANSGVDIGDVDIGGGLVAHGAADSGNPLKIGAKAVASLEGVTLVDAADRADCYTDLDGALLTRQSAALGDLVSERVSNTDGSSTAFTNFGAVASTKNYVRGYSVYNSSATAGYVDFRDGTAGSVLWTVPLPAGGGAQFICSEPIFKTSANTALAYDVSGALSTVYISVTGYQSKL